MFDVNERETFTHLRRWLEELELYATTQHAAMLLVGNKIDLKRREVSVEEAREFARKQAMLYIEASAKVRPIPTPLHRLPAAARAPLHASFGCAASPPHTAAARRRQHAGARFFSRNACSTHMCALLLRI